MRRLPDLGTTQALALMPGEGSLLVKAGTDGGVILDAATGSVLDVPAPLDRLEVEIVHADADGSFVVGYSGSVLRMSHAGDVLPLFPEEKIEQPGFFTRVFGSVAERRTRIEGKHALLLPGGDLLVLEGSALLTLVRYDRKGERLSARKTELEDDPVTDTPMQADGDDLYVLAGQRLWRLSAEIAAPLAIEDPVDAFVVLPGGALVLFGPRGAIRSVAR